VIIVEESGLRFSANWLISATADKDDKVDAAQ